VTEQGGRKVTATETHSFVLPLSICFRPLPLPPEGSHPPVFTSLHSPHDLPTARNRYHGEELGGRDLGGCFHHDPTKSSFPVASMT